MTSSSLGLRNWRGQIVEPLANFAAADVADPTPAPTPPAGRDDALSPRKSVKKHKKDKRKASRRHAADSDASDGDRADVVFVKDEFGRDVPLEKTTRKVEEKRKKHPKRSRSPDTPPRYRGTPPPADPIRPQLDEDRGRRGSRRRRERSRSRSRSRSRDRGHRRGRGRSRSASPGRRHRERSRSRSRSRPRDVSRITWTHDGFENRSPSPVRDVVPGYKPEPEQWVSRAGGVYLPRKT